MSSTITQVMSLYYSFIFSSKASVYVIMYDQLWRFYPLKDVLQKFALLFLYLFFSYLPSFFFLLLFLFLSFSFLFSFFLSFSLSMCIHLCWTQSSFLGTKLYEAKIFTSYIAPKLFLQYWNYTGLIGWINKALNLHIHFN